MKKLKCALIISLLVQVIFGTMIASADSSKASDIDNHWAKDAITLWQSKGVINGYPDGTFKPNQTITRAEFVSILNKVFQVEKEHSGTVSFADLDETHWAYEQIKTALAHGYITGKSETSIAPNAAITREEAAVMLARLLNQSKANDKTFIDIDQASSWSLDALNALAGLGILQGDSNGKLNPKALLTRAEAVVLIDKSSSFIETIFSEEGTYGDLESQTVINGNVRVLASGVKLVNTVITGNLIIDKAVGEGDVYLNKVEVKGETVINGGGMNSIHLEDSIIINLIADKATGTVRIVAIGSTVVQEVFVKSSAKLEESNSTNTGFNNVQITSDLPSNTEVELLGTFEKVNVFASKIKIAIPSGKVNELNVDNSAEGAQISVSREATILALLLNIAAQITGDGTIENAIIAPGAENSSFSNKPKVIEGDDSKIVILPPTTPPASVPSNPPVTPPVTPPASNSTDATLHSITVTSAVYIDWHKELLLNSSTLDIKGFDPQHLNYFTLADDTSVGTTELSFKLTSHQDASIYVSYTDDSRVYTNVTKNDQGEYSITYDSSEYISIQVRVRSGNMANWKSYKFDIIPKLNINETGKLIYSDGTYTSFHTSGVLHGDKITVTVPAENSSSGEAFTASYDVDNSNSIYKYNYTGGSVPLVIYSPNTMKFVKTTNKGQLHVNILRNGETIVDGYFNYDLTPLEVVQLDEDAYDLEFMTKAQLLEYDLTRTDIYKAALRYDISYDIAKLKELYGEFTYFSYNSQYNASNELTLESLKKNYYTISKNALDLLSIIPYSVQGKYNTGLTHVYNPTTALIDGVYYLNQSNTDIYLTLFNSDKEVIKVLHINVDYPEWALGENVEFANK